MNPNECSPGQGNGNGNAGRGTTIIVTKQPSLLINGGMGVSQRGGTYSSVSSTQYTLDRWQMEFSGSPGAVVDISRVVDVPAGSGQSRSLKIDCTTDEAAVGAAEAIVLKTTIEAQDLQHLMYGDEINAQSTCLSFWVKSPKSGTHCAALYMPDGDVHNIQEYNVSAANAWEFKIIVFPGYPTSTIADDNGAGLTISFPLVAGNDFQGNKDVWETGNDYATAEQQNLLDSTSNDFCVTGVKFEVGETATGFDFRSCDDEIIACQRYFRRVDFTTQNMSAWPCIADTTTTARLLPGFERPMRAGPSLGYSIGTMTVVDQNSGNAITSMALQGANIYGGRVNITTSGLTTGDAVYLDQSSATPSGYIEFDAEF
jgi:hypothetical protein